MGLRLSVEMHTQERAVNQCVAPAAHVVDDAVGVAEAHHWYVAIVNHNSEVSTAQKLAAMGYEAFAAAQPETRVWANGRRHVSNRIAIGSVVFICCTETQRREIVALPYISRFLADRANSKPVATIPDSQIEMLRFMLGQADSRVEFVDRQYCIGETVKVSRGRLINAEGTIARLPNGRGELTITLGALGGAKCVLPLSDIAPIR